MAVRGRSAWRPTRSAMVAVAVLALVASGCGDDTTPSAGPDATTTSATSPTTSAASAADDPVFPLEPGWEGTAWPVPATPEPGPHVNDVTVELLDDDGAVVGTGYAPAGTPLQVRVPPDDPDHVEIAWADGTTARAARADMWFIPSFIELRNVTVEIDGETVPLVESGMDYHRVGAGTFDDPDTPEFDGIAGPIRRFLRCEADDWKIANQYFAADLIADGLYAQDRELVEKGVAGLDWGIAQQLDDDAVFTLTRDCDGLTLRDDGETHHSTQWLTGAARGVHLLAATPWAGEFRDHIDAYIAHLETLAGHLIDPAVRAHWIERWVHDPQPDRGVFNHKFYMRAAGLGLVADLTRDPDFADALREDAHAIATEGMAVQWDDGVNPERGGFDVRYQMYGTWLAEVYWSTLPPGEHREALGAMIDRAIAWMSTRIDPVTGEVDIEGSTRTCQNDPTVSEYHPYHFESAYLLWDRLQDGDGELSRLAVLHDQAHRRTGSPCPPVADG